MDYFAKETPEQRAARILKSQQWEMEQFKKRAPCPYGIVTFAGLPLDSYCVVHTLVIDDKYVMKDELNPLVRRWIRNTYVEWEPENWKTISLIVS